MLVLCGVDLKVCGNERGSVIYLIFSLFVRPVFTVVQIAGRKFK